MHLAAVPIVHGVSFQRVIVFMVAADEGKREGQAFQPVQRFIVAAVTKPHTAQSALRDDHIAFRHPGFTPQSAPAGREESSREYHLISM